MRVRKLGGIVSVAALAAVLTVLAPAWVTAGEWVGDANLFAGQKQLNQGDFEPMDRQDELGVELSLGKKEWPARIAVDILSSSKKKTVEGILEEGGPVVRIHGEGSSLECAFGVRKIWNKKSFHPFFGGGIAYLAGKIEGGLPDTGLTFSQDTNMVGIWIGGGAFWRLGPHFNLGAEARLSKGLVEFSSKGDVPGESLEGGGLHLGAILGWAWPASK